MVLIHHRTTTWTVKDKVTDDVEVKDVEVKNEVEDEVRDNVEDKVEDEIKNEVKGVASI